MLGLPARYATTVRFRGPCLRELDQQTIANVEADLKAYVDKGGLRVRRGGSVWSSCGLRSDAELRAVLLQLDAPPVRAT